MPDLEERLEVRRFTLGIRRGTDALQILQASSRKIEIDKSVDYHTIAEATEGYSGADLQAVMYNAHLEVVHSTIAEQEKEAAAANTRTDDESVVKFAAFGGASSKTVASRAEEAALQRRVGLC